MNILKWLFNPAWFTFSFGGGGGGTTSTGTTYTSNIPEYLEPYVTKMTEATEKQVYQGEGFKPYQSYAQYDQARGGTGETVAGFTPMQTQAMRGIQNYQMPQQTQYGSQMAGMAGLGSMRAGQQYARQATNPYATQAYMSPYMEASVAPQMREAARQSAMQGQMNQAQAVQQGAFGGSRSAIVEAERQRNLQQQLGDIYGKGSQTAFEQAQQAQQFGANLNMQGLGQGLQGAQALGALGQQQYGQELGLLGQQQAVGKMQQDFEQNRLNQIVQDYATSQQYPLMQLGVLSNMLRGLPMQASTTQMYQAQPSAASQAMGSIGAGLELYKTAKSAFGANGGAVKEYANGGIATGVPPAKLPSMLEKLSDDQLGKKDQDKETDPATKQMVGAEQVRRGALRNGIKTMAAGGAVAFNGAERSDVEDKEKDKDKEKKEKTTNEGILGALEKSPTTPAEGTNPIPPVAPETDPYTGLDTYPDLKGSVADEARKGIAAAKPAVGPTRENMYAAQEKLLADQAAAEKTKSERTVNQVIAAQNEERKAAGFVDPAIAEAQTIDERKAKIAGDTREAAQDRLTQFLINWGKFPGPALNGFIGAADKLIEGNIEDKKLRKKMLEDLEDVRLSVNRGVYERRLGNEKEARAEIAKAGEQYYAINEKILQHKEKVYLKQLDLENKIAQMELKGEIAALKGSQNKAAIVQQAEIKARALVQKYVREINAGTMTVEQIEDMALNDVLSRQPQVAAAQTTVVPQLQNAATNQGKAETDIAEAETKRFDAITKRNEKVATEIRNSLVLGEGRKQVLAAEEKARKAGGDAAAIKAAGEAVAAKVTRDIEAKNPLPQAVRTQTPAPAPAKTKGKDAEPAPKAETPPKISDVQGVPDGAKIGKRISAGKYEVLDSAGKLIGHTS
jgi:hypothetical protein